MGSTGHSLISASRLGDVNNETFGIANAVNYTGNVPTNSGLEKPGSGKITLKLPADKKNSVIFQFRLSRDASLMMITGYKNGIPEVRAKVRVDSGHPSLDKVIKSGSPRERSQAVKMKELMNASTKVDESQLGSIANKLLSSKKKRS